MRTFQMMRIRLVLFLSLARAFSSLIRMIAVDVLENTVDSRMLCDSLSVTPSFVITFGRNDVER